MSLWCLLMMSAVCLYVCGVWRLTSLSAMSGLSDLEMLTVVLLCGNTAAPPLWAATPTTPDIATTTTATTTTTSTTTTLPFYFVLLSLCGGVDTWPPVSSVLAWSGPSVAWQDRKQKTTAMASQVWAVVWKPRDTRGLCGQWWWWAPWHVLTHRGSW